MLYLHLLVGLPVCGIAEKVTEQFSRYARREEGLRRSKKKLLNLWHGLHPRIFCHFL